MIDQIRTPRAPYYFQFGMLLIVTVILVFGLAIPVAPRLSAVVASRYADNVRLGNGLVFNTNESVLLLLQPVSMLVEAALTPNIMVLVSGILAALLVVIRFDQQIRLTPFVLYAALLIMAAIAWISTYSLPATACAGCFALLAVFGLTGKQTALRLIIAGVFAALALLSRPAALLLFVLPAVMITARREQFTRFAIGFAVASVAILLALTWQREVLWTDLLLLKISPVELPDLILLLPVLFLYLASQLQPEPPTAAIRRLDRPVFMILIGVLIVIAVIAVGANLPLGSRPFAPDTVEVATIDQAVAALASKTGSGFNNPTRIALTRVDNAALLQYVLQSVPPDTEIIALDGQFHPEVRRLIESNNAPAALMATLPEVIIANGGFRTSLITESVQGYTRVFATDGLVLFIGPSYREFKNNRQIIIKAFGPHLSLLTADVDDLRGNQNAIQVVLQWQVMRSATDPITVQATYAEKMVEQVYSPATFRAGMHYTFLVLPYSSPQAPSTVTITALVNNGTLGQVTLDIPANGLASSN